MKKIFAVIIILGVVNISFSDTINNSKNPLMKGKRLAKKCAWCHDINRKLLAPPFKVILDRYKDVPDKQLKKQFFDVIKNGSKDRWKNWLKENIKIKMGKLDTMYMPPQKSYFTDEEIKLIVNWLLSLRKQ